jgi:copper homeostasis protein
MKTNVLLEVCVDSVESAVAAERGGAHRVELCTSLFNGGVTPSAGLIATVRQAITIPLHVMIRPRGSDFCYSDAEFQVMQRDILMAKQLRTDAVVFGILDLDGSVDGSRTKQLLDLAAPLTTTFHRAFDMSSDLVASLRDLQLAGVHRVLTSGGKQTAVEGAATLKALVAAAAGTIAIVAGGGITNRNVLDLIDQTGVREIHATLRSTVPSPMRYHNDAISLGAEKNTEYQRLVVQEQTVQKLLQAASQGK